MADLGRLPKPHNRPTKDAKRPFYKGILSESVNRKEQANGTVAVGKGANSVLFQTEQANSRFLSEVQNIPGVAAAQAYGGKDLADQSIVVFVPTLLSDVSEQVTELRTRVYRMYPDARLEVRIKGLRERGIDPSNVTEADIAQL